MTSHWVMSPGPTPLVVIGPPGTQSVVDGMMAMFAPDQGYRLAHHQDLNEGPIVVVTEVEPGDVVELAGVSIEVHRTDHRPVAPTVGYRSLTRAKWRRSLGTPCLVARSTNFAVVPTSTCKP